MFRAADSEDCGLDEIAELISLISLEMQPIENTLWHTNTSNNPA